MTQDTEAEDESRMSRRMVLAGIGAAAVSGFAAGQGSAATGTPSGDAGSLSNPYEQAFVDRVVFNERSSDPSSPEDGTLWYNPGA